MAHGHGSWLWPMEQSQRAHMAAGSVEISGAISVLYWWKFEVYEWLFEAIFGAVKVYIRGLFSLIIRVVSRLHIFTFNTQLQQVKAKRRNLKDSNPVKQDLNESRFSKKEEYNVLIQSYVLFSNS